MLILLLATFGEHNCLRNAWREGAFAGLGFRFRLCYAFVGLGDGHWNVIDFMFAMLRFTWTLTGSIVWGIWSRAGFRGLAREWSEIGLLLCQLKKLKAKKRSIMKSESTGDLRD